MALNGQIKVFYQKYTTYLNENFSDLCQRIDTKNPQASLAECCWSVQHALSEQKNEKLAGVQGIYLLVDEYDAFANDHIEQHERHETDKHRKIAWADTDVGRTFRSFWSMVKSMGSEGIIERAFITGISPLSLSGIGSAFNVASNLSFHRDLATFCGLTRSELEDALQKLGKDGETCEQILSEMTKHFNGYHFCRSETVETVYNTETCLEYLQHIALGITPDPRNPQNSEVSETFLEKFATSEPVRADMEEAIERDKMKFKPFDYGELKGEFTLEDLVCYICPLSPFLLTYISPRGITIDLPGVR